MRPSLAGWLSALASIGSLTTAHAVTVISTPADVAAKVTTLQPGDVLELRTDAGNYVSGLSIYNLAGTASQPITIRGPVSGARPVFEGSATDNVIRIRNSAFIAVQNLEVDGKGRIGDAINVNGGNCSHDVVIENVYIHDMAADQQGVGISTNGCTGSSWNWTIRGNRIERVGTGMYLGNYDGSHQFFASTIEYNTIIDTIGYNIEIKHQNPRPTIAGMPTGDSRTIIRHNVFSKSAGNSSTGGEARPNLLVGHMPLSGPGQNDRYEIYGNFFFQNPTEVLFQGEGNLFFYDNVLYNSFGTAVAIMPHNDVPRDVHVFNNTVVAAGTGISISGGASGFAQEAFANAVYAGTPLSGGTRRDNVADTFAQAATFLNNPSSNIAVIDLFPKSPLTGSVVIYSTVSVPAVSLGAATDWNKDFNGFTQPATVRGAYVGGGTNPGWKLSLSRKPDVPGTSTTPLPGAPSVALTASPANIALNGVATLSWLSDGTSCSATGGSWTGAKSIQGTQQVGPLTANASYELTCSNASGSTARTVTVSILPAPLVALSAGPGIVYAGQLPILTWLATNADTCTANGAWAGNKATSGTETLPTLAVTSDFSLSCTGAGGSTTSATVTVVVNNGPQPSDVVEKSSGGGALSTFSVACLSVLTAACMLNRDRAA